MLRAITLPQVGAVAVGHHARCERLASGHVLLAGRQMALTRVLDPSLGDSHLIDDKVAAVHMGEKMVAAPSGPWLRVRRIGSREPLGRRFAFEPGRTYRFSPAGTHLWELARRRWRWRARLSGVEGRGHVEAVLPAPERSIGAWTIVAEHPRQDALVVKSLARHLAIERGAGGALAVRPLPIDVFIDWAPDGLGYLGATFDGALRVHRWDGGEVVRSIETRRLTELLGDQLGLHGTVIDLDRALLDTLGGRLIVVDLGDATAEVVEVKLHGDARPIGLAHLGLGTSGRVLTGRAGDDLLRIWDGEAVVRTIPARHAHR